MTAREWSSEEKSKSAAAAYIRRAAEDGLPAGVALPDRVNLLLTDEWPGNASSIESIREAIEELRDLGERHACRGRFWRRLMRAASLIGATDLEIDLRERYRRALLRLKGASSPGG